ncbi:MAG TPA: CehA/McbA family metallohydrolase [Kofleriaceae bacterium]|nr:CehA/McbA family metallohydrolase [Kofleriaceae bacterium]
MKLAVLAALACTTCVGSDPPHSSAQRIGKLEQAIGGPHAIGQVGDWLLQNDQVRFIVEDKGVGRVNTSFGGSLIDADLQRIANTNTGNDELAELLPGFVFSVIDPVDVCIPNAQGACPTDPSEPVMDGTDGGPAEILVTGVCGDLFEMVALLNTGLVFPSDLSMSQLYKLVPGDRYVTIETTIKNNATGAHPFPYLNPTDLDNLLGMNIPGISSIQLSVPLGQFPLLGGEQSLFVPGVAGFNVRFAIEDTYGTGPGFPAFPGMVADFIASRGPGVSYGISIPSTPDNYVNSYASGYPGQDITPFSMLLPFTYAGVTGAYMYKPPDQLNAGEQRTYESYFYVGKGDVGSIYDAVLQQRGQPNGTFGGRVVDELTQAAISTATVLVFDSTGAKILDELDTDAGGNFLGHLPPGMYTYLVLEDTRPDAATDSGGNIAATPQPFVVVAGGQTGAFVQMHAPATIDVEAVDELGRHAPAKIQLIGHNAAIQGTNGNFVDGRNILYSLARGERVRPTAFDGSDRYVENAWWTVDGRLDAPVRPGTYDLVVSRGPEYELFTKTITIAAGSYSAQLVQLQRSFDTPGWIAGDFHVHSQPSTDSGLPISDRVTSCAAEGLEVAVATDHNYITDYSPVIANLQLDQWLLGVPGMELTTFEMGHFIGYPLKVDPGSTRGGEFVWAKQAPESLFTQLRGLAIDPNNSVVTVAHPRQPVLGYWSQFYVDAATAEPYTPTGIMGVFAPYGDEFSAANFSFDYDAVELITGRRLEDVHTFIAPDPLPPGPFPDPQPVPGQPVVGADGRPQFPGVVETWMTMLDRGKMITGMGASDSHHMLTDEPGYARTYVFVGDGNDVPGGYTRDEVIAGIRAHHAIATTAPFIAMTVGTHMIGDEFSMSGPVPVAIEVKSPSWAPVNELKLYSNGGAIVADVQIPAPGTDFTTTINVAPPSDGTDMWIVAEALGSSNEFPVNSATEFPPLDVSVIIGALATGIDLSSLPIAAKLKPPPLHYSRPYAITNPMWIDTNGDGKWTPPKPPLPATLEGSGASADVRQQFDALPEVSR